MKKFIVTRDQRTDFTGVANTDIAVWDYKDGAFDTLAMDGDGCWGYPETGGGPLLGLIDEIEVDAFEETYGIAPPRAGTKNVLRADYTWE